MQLTSEFTKIFLFVSAAAGISVAGAYSSGVFVDEPTLSARIDTDIQYLTSVDSDGDGNIDHRVGFMWFTIHNDGDVPIIYYTVNCIYDVPICTDSIKDHANRYTTQGFFPTAKFQYSTGPIQPGEQKSEKLKMSFDTARGDILTLEYNLFKEDTELVRKIQQVVVR